MSTKTEDPAQVAGRITDKSDIEEIVNLWRLHVPVPDLARMFGVNHQAIWKVLTTHVPADEYGLRLALAFLERKGGGPMKTYVIQQMTPVRSMDQLQRVLDIGVNMKLWRVWEEPLGKNNNKSKLIELARKDSRMDEAQDSIWVSMHMVGHNGTDGAAAAGMLQAFKQELNDLPMLIDVNASDVQVEFCIGPQAVETMTRFVTKLKAHGLRVMTELGPAY